MPAGPSPAQRSSTDTKARIILVAQEVFAAKGYSHAGLREIAAAARVAPSLLIKYFGTKGKLFEETLAAYPQFSKMDEFLYIAGMSSYYLSRNEGKQKVNLKSEREKDKYAPEKLKEDAIAYFSMIIDKYPDSKFREDAEKTLKEIKPGS